MSRKFLVTIVLILFLLPFVSWYYLQSGLTWRKHAQEIMNGTTPFPSGELIDLYGRKFSDALLEDHVSLVAFYPCAEKSEEGEVLEKIYNQFKDTGKAAYILLDTCRSVFVTDADSLKNSWYVIPSTDAVVLYKSLIDHWPSGKSFALVDRNKVIRSYYAIGTKDEKRIFLEHMALLLPREHQEKVELKRGEKK